ncbi:MAG: metallophosphoesterase family protein [Desulforhopalus sp.]
MITVGILSDTHLQSTDDNFISRCTAAFNGCDVIIHAGDLTDIAVLSAFQGKDVHAVCGNMCSQVTKKVLPGEKEIVLGGYSIAITHGTGPRHNIEERLFSRFPASDCIIFGHTHLPVCTSFGSTLLINPGSFQDTGRYGAGCSYALLRIDHSGLRATIHNLARTS